MIDETQIVTYQIEPQTPKEVRYSIFNRINTGALKLNAQEIRQALNQKGIAVQFLKQQCETPEFQRVVNISSDRMLDRELALRFFAFHLLPLDDSFKSLPSFLDRAMEVIDQQTAISPELETLVAKFSYALKLSEWLLGPNHKFCKAIIGEGKKSLNRSLFEVLTVCLSQMENTSHFTERHQQEFKCRLVAMLENKQSVFSQAILQGTNSKRAVVDRFTEMNKLINDIENMA